METKERPFLPEVTVKQQEIRRRVFLRVGTNFVEHAYRSYEDCAITEMTVEA